MGPLKRFALLISCLLFPHLTAGITNIQNDFNGTIALVPRQTGDISLPITNPVSKTDWSVLSTESVSWDTSNLPSGSSLTGKILLGFVDSLTGGPNGHLNLDHPLAQGFSLASGKVSFQVPNVPTRLTYVVVLMINGVNSIENQSPQFLISPEVLEIPPGQDFTSPTPTMTDFNGFIDTSTPKGTTSSSGSSPTQQQAGNNGGTPTASPDGSSTGGSSPSSSSAPSSGSSQGSSTTGLQTSNGSKPQGTPTGPNLFTPVQATIAAPAGATIIPDPAIGFTAPQSSSAQAHPRRGVAIIFTMISCILFVVV